MRNTGHCLVAAAALAAALASAGAEAQTAPPKAATPEAGDRNGDGTGNAGAQDTASADIVVTARRRDETLQKVPLAIDVVGAKALATTGASSLTDIPSVAPGVNIAKAPNSSQVGVTIRGLGSSPGSTSFDSSVSLFVDGIYAARSREFASSMFDVQRIEVIKGTQAALLGKNTSLGAVNLVTRKPGDRVAADIRASYEFEFGSTLVTGGIDLPLTDNLAVRVSGQTLDDRGWIRNVVSGRNNPRNRDDAGRVVVAWNPTPGISLTGFAQHDVTRTRGTPAEFVSLNPLVEGLQALAGAPGTLDGTLDRRNATSFGGLGGEQFESLAVDRYGLTANIDLGGVTLTSITGYSRYRDVANGDVDFQAGDYQNLLTRERSSSFSQEVRLVSSGERRFDYVVGGLFIRNILHDQENGIANYPFGPPPTGTITGSFLTDFHQATTTGSFFGQGTFKLTPKLQITGGVRYTTESKDVDVSRTVLVPGFYSLAIFPPYAPFSRSRKDNPFDYSGGVQYSVTPDILAYVSYGKGTKSGGFASTATLLDQGEYSNETARTIEGGIKAQDPGRRWLVNLSAFHTRVDDFQVVTFNGTGFVIFNTDLRSDGFELQSYWYPTKAIRLFLNNTFADAKDRRTGQPIPLAPRWSGSGGFAVRTRFAPGVDFLFDGSVDYRSSRTYQQDPAAATVSPPFTTLNLAIALAKPDDRFEIRLFGRNLLDAIAPAFAFPTPIVGTQSAVPERGRTLTLQVSARF